MGEIRSLLPAAVKVLALTATATKTLRGKVAEVIGLIDPLVISVCPCKPNIVYTMSSFISLPDTFDPLLHELRNKRTSFPRTIVYCRTLEQCSKLYRLFRTGLGDGFTEPPDALASLSRFRLVEMYTNCVDVEVKSQIILSFSSDIYPLRIIFATVALGWDWIVQMSGKSFTWVLLMTWNHISRKLDEEEGMENLHWHCYYL